MPEKPDIKMIPVTSSHVAAIGHDAENAVLYVDFQDGASYRYLGVEAETFQALLQAPSVGKALYNSIKGNYACEKIN